MILLVQGGSPCCLPFDFLVQKWRLLTSCLSTVTLSQVVSSQVLWKEKQLMNRSIRGSGLQD